MELAIGISMHTGWAVAVAVGGPVRSPTVVDRRRLVLCDDALPRQVFHAAAELPAVQAERLVHEVERCAGRNADREVTAMADELCGAGHRVVGVAIDAEPRTLPEDVTAIVANHTLIHSAEGELYRDAVEAAAIWRQLDVLHVRAKDVTRRVTDGLGLQAAGQLALFAALGKALGAPWQADHKRATVLGLLALQERSGDQSTNENRNSCVA
jgi:hypothetical protein